MKPQKLTGFLVDVMDELTSPITIEELFVFMAKEEGR